MLRRALALLLLVCLGQFMVEAAVADVHDGDATHEELVAVDGAAHRDGPGAVNDRAPTCAQQDACARAPHAGAPSESHSGERAPGAPGHALHVCHCVHAHGATLSRVPTVAASTVDLGGVALPPVTLAPMSRALEPGLRPPIV